MLLDTHIFLWWLFDDPKLPANVRAYIQDRENPVFVSAASVWEITTKFRLGKLPHAGSVAKNVPMWIRKAGFEPMPITPEHAQLAGEWRVAHRDPFDRMLAAQAHIEKMPLATVDSLLGAFDVDIFNGKH
jgi:PIN domain nuclease of toxin-antitoxin system